jgi:DNA gyrase/topoisomerase IV subunit A
MKISDKNFNYLFNTAINNNHYDVIKKLFKLQFELDERYILTASIRKELMSIAKEFDDDYECEINVNDEADVCVMLPDMIMYTRLAGDPKPYSEFADEDEDGFDAIGEWTIFLSTKEVEFEVDVTT